MLLKGAALVRTLYDDPGLRHLGDLDLLVAEPDVLPPDRPEARRVRIVRYPAIASIRGRSSSRSASVSGAFVRAAAVGT